MYIMSLLCYDGTRNEEMRSSMVIMEVLDEAIARLVATGEYDVEDVRSHVAGILAEYEASVDHQLFARIRLQELGR
jgi:hypothetical protein